jgi:rare lipoprotein A
MKWHMRAAARRTVLPAAATGIALLVALTPAAGGTETTGVTIAASKGSARVGYGQRVRLRGATGSANAGKPVTIEYAPRGVGFSSVGQAKTGPDGVYVFNARPKRSGAFRAVLDGQGASAPQSVEVLARISGKATRQVKQGGTATLTGVLEPARRGRKVVVQSRTNGGWKPVAKAKTAGKGRFSASWNPSRPGRYAVRVRFGGDGRNAAAARTFPEHVNVLRPGGASWYGGGAGACGIHAKYGVAHKSLPCGTRVTLMYRGRSVTATVTDRGPYVGGRVWDLTPSVKRKLGFGDVGTVWSTS